MKGEVRVREGREPLGKKSIASVLNPRGASVGSNDTE